MVCCDVCLDWYHLRCCNLTAAAAKSAVHWACPICASAAAHPPADLVEPHLPRIHVTRCATLEVRPCMPRMHACGCKGHS